MRRYSHITIQQPNYNLASSLSQLHKLSDHFIDIFRIKFQELSTFESWLPPQTDFRCNLLAYHLLVWEIHAILAPEQIKINFFDLLCIKGGAIFRTFAFPNGKLYVRNKKSYRSVLLEKNPRMVPVYDMILRLSLYFNPNKVRNAINFRDKFSLFEDDN